MKNKRKLLWIVPALILIFLAGFVIWANTPPQPETVAIQALQSDDTVSVTFDNNRISFLPTGESSQTALIFYPGGRVDYRSYAPIMHGIAEQGFPVFLLKMPLNLAVFGINRAEPIISSQTGIDTWVVGGHSLGGSMAASFTNAHLDTVDGLLLLASYPAENDNLSNTDLAVLSISASEDGLATAQDIEASRKLLPQDTRWLVIEGGNHAQFGSYGMQTGDNPATISATEQQQQVISATVDFMKMLHP